MKKILLMLLLLISVIKISLIGYRKSIDQGQLYEQNVKPERHFKNKLKNAEVIGYCKNGKVMFKGNFKNGKKDGEWLIYYKSGEVKLKINYKDGKKID